MSEISSIGSNMNVGAQAKVPDAQVKKNNSFIDLFKDYFNKNIKPGEYHDVTVADVNNKAKEVYDMMIKSGAKVVAQEDGKTTFDNGVIVYHSDGHLEVDSGAFGSPCALMNALDASGLNEDCVMVFDGDESVQYEGMKNDSGEVFFHTTKVDFGQDGINVKHQSNSEYVGK